MNRTHSEGSRARLSSSQDSNQLIHQEAVAGLMMSTNPNVNLISLRLC